jgi:hypothetical protein
VNRANGHSSTLTKKTASVQPQLGALIGPEKTVNGLEKTQNKEKQVAFNCVYVPPNYLSSLNLHYHYMYVYNNVSAAYILRCDIISCAFISI